MEVRPPDLRRLDGWVTAEVGKSEVVSVTDLTQAGEGDGPWLFELRSHGSVVRVVLHLGDAVDQSLRARFEIQHKVLELAAGSGIRAPRVLAVDFGAETGRLALLQTALAGSSHIPVRADPVRLRTIGRELGAIHSVVPAGDIGLPRRSRSLEGVDFAVSPMPERSAVVFARAHELMERISEPYSGTVLVHGDFWQGNTLWQADDFVGTVDWDFAGVGHPGIDLGSLRCDAAVMFGMDAPAEVARGWEESSGHRAEDLAYWDVVSCLCMPADLRYWLPNFHHQGRGDLDWETVTARRDAHLARALDELS